ncbi:hypothetical protein DQ392_23085 [Streptomyces reniochalinae]|uniref:Uncharacterized protein n=2 Tax=Streptomyces reniochalinae TaxID=2250578 RepID=A0A367EE76_9ACTN|nr:hypothetical protein DQ392_23085 [Streptomyces reniochalinae]
MTSGVSGMVLTHRHGHGGFDALIVRDNKKPGENRLAEVAYRPGQKADVQPLDWKGSDVPVDLESLDEVPGHHGQYVAVASEGKGYRFDVDGGTAHVRDTFTLPGIGEDDNIEDFALTSRHGKPAAVWADRGQDQRPSTVYAARVSLGAHRTGFGAVTDAELRAPYPAEHVRHASDLKITASGSLLVSSASDPGDDGPFDSAVYTAGTVAVHRSGAALHIADDPDVLETFPDHKIEALACLPGSRTGALGTDDENAGGALRTARFCER